MEACRSRAEGAPPRRLQDTRTAAVAPPEVPEYSRVSPYRLEERALIDLELTNRSIDFMRRNVEADQPFFLYLPYTQTHYPALPHPDFKGKTGNGRWADVLAQVDAYNGMLLDAVDELGIRDNTIFIFTADNGPEALPQGTNTAAIEPPIPGSAGPWRGTLFTGFEGSLRVPFVVRWPGQIPAGSVSDGLVSEMDLFPTLARMTGGTVPDDRVIDGVDQTDFFLGRQTGSNREGLIVYMGNDLVTLEGGVGRSFIQGAASVGLAYFAQWKVTDDRLEGLPSLLLPGKNKVFGLGPELTMPLFASGPWAGLVTVRYKWELGAESAFEGQWFHLSVTLARIGWSG